MAWVLLVGLVASGVWLLPRLQTEFNISATLHPAHPERVRFEEYFQRFGLNSSLFLLVRGEKVFAPKTLETLEKLAQTLRKTEGTHSVVSPLDLHEPFMDQGRLGMFRPLGPYSRSQKEDFERRLHDPAWRKRWADLLFPEDLSSLFLVVTPNFVPKDPVYAEAYLARIEARAAQALQDLPVELYKGGDFFQSQEMMRATGSDQLRLTTFSSVLQFLLISALFGSVWVGMIVLSLVGLSTYLGFLCMAAFEIPINFMSGNLPVMVGVIGLADILHILGNYSQLLRIYKPRGAAIRAMRRTFWPNLFTTLTTLGCVSLNVNSDLRILSTFSTSLCIGIGIVYWITMIYGPLLLMRSGMRYGEGGYYALQSWLSRWLLQRTHRPKDRTQTLKYWIFLALALSFLTGTQTIDSNWLRNFDDSAPLSQTLRALQSDGLPVSSAEYTIPLNQGFSEILRDTKLRDDLRRVKQSLEGIPGVVGSVSLGDILGAVDDAWNAMPWPQDLKPVWKEARKRSVYRRYYATGAMDPYWNEKSQELRLVVRSNLESSSQLLDLNRQILRVLRSQPYQVLDSSQLTPQGGLLFWAQIIQVISEDLLRTLIGSLGVIFLCFLLLTQDLKLSLWAMAPNAMPLLTLLGVAKLAGHPISEEFCTLAALTIGISVDDTLHLLYHYVHARKGGEAAPEAIYRSLRHCGSALVLTTLCLTLGFIICLDGTTKPVWRTGAFLTPAILMALWADLSLLPALLIQTDTSPAPGEDRQYRILPSSKIVRAWGWHPPKIP